MSSEQMYRSVKDYYAILGVSDRDSREEMRHALGQPATKYHPDGNLGNERPAGGQFREIKAGYAMLGGEAKQWGHDRMRWASSARGYTQYADRYYHNQERVSADAFADPYLL